MYRFVISIALLVTTLLVPSYAQMPRHNVSQIPGNTRNLKLQPPRVQPSTTSHPAWAPAVVPTPCPPDVQSATCGFVEVPLDREHPNGAKISIYFQLYPHSSPGPAESAILVNFGGPGVSTTQAPFARLTALSVFAANLDVHDLLLIDDRGTGLSADIDCAPLQHGTEPFVRSVADCAKQLGDAASFFGRGDNAQDVETVRSALGYDQVDYYGGSYGGLDVAAYATRFGEHLRSIILDAPAGTPFLKPFAAEHFRTDKDPTMVKLDCVRSPTCSPDHPNPILEFDRLVTAIRQQPVQGNAHDAGGNLVSVRIDEEALLNFLVGNIRFPFVNIGELLAAAAALEKGDSVPILRLGAEDIFPLGSDFDSFDPNAWSAGAHYAMGCVDTEQPWDWSDPTNKRAEEYAEAVSELPSGFFAPFSKRAATGLLFSQFGNRCLTWENPHPPGPAVPRHAIYPHTPTLVLDGDLDNGVPLEETSKVASFFPNSTSVTIAGAGHETVFWFQCAANLISTFLETRQVTDTSCASTPEVVWPAVGRFPLLAADARPAAVDPHGSNQIGLAERKVVTVAVAAATDALQRIVIGPGDGVGLRGGSFHTDFGNTLTTTLSNCVFANDVIVNGTITWNAFSDDSFVADLAVSGPGTSGGTLHVQGFWLAPGPVGNISVSGILGNKRVAALVPQA
jgi:pimeloyl-ACP methyl ester carboxylesterase